MITKKIRAEAAAEIEVLAEFFPATVVLWMMMLTIEPGTETGDDVLKEARKRAQDPVAHTRARTAYMAAMSRDPQTIKAMLESFWKHAERRGFTRATEHAGASQPPPAALP